MANNKEYRTALIVTGDAKGGVRATKLTSDAVEKLEQQQLKGESAAKRYARSFGNATKTLIKYSAAAIAVGSITLFPAAAIADAARFESQLVAVGKTTDIVGKDLKSLGKDVDAMSQRIPVSTSRLLDLATSAGQLGVKGSGNILAFTETLAKLEQTTDLVGEEGAKSIARILNVTGDGIETVDRFGSVLVALGNNSAASEREIVRITTEIARSASAFGVGATEAAAMGAAMASIGIRAELGGSAVGRTMQTITDALQRGESEAEKFARQFGLSGEALAVAFERDKVEGLVMFLEGVAAQGQSAGTALDAVGLGGQEIAKTIVPLANNLELLRDALGLAAKEAENATALDEEFAKSLETLTAQAILFKNNVTATGRALLNPFLPAITDAFEGVNKFMSGGNVLEIIKGSLLGIAAAVAVGGTLHLGLLATTASVTGLAAAVGALTFMSAPLWLVAGAITGVAVAASQMGPTLIEQSESARRSVTNFVRVTSIGWEQAKFAGKSALNALEKAWEGYINLVKESAAQWVEQIAEMASVGEGIVPFAGKLASAARNVASTIRASKVDLDQYNRKQREFTLEYIAATDSIRNATDAMLGLTPVVVTATKWAEKNADATQEQAKAAEESTKLTAEQTERLKDLQDELDPVRVLVEEFGKNQDLLNLAFEKGAITQVEYENNLRALTSQFEEARNAALGMKEETSALATEWERTIERIDDAGYDLFRSLFDDWSSFKDQLLDSAKDLAAQMAYQFAKQQFGFNATQLAFAGGGNGGSIGSLVGSAAGSSSSGIGTGVLGGALGGAAGLMSGLRVSLGITKTSLAQLTPGGLTSDLTAGATRNGFNFGGFNFQPLDFLKTAGAGIAGGFLGSGLGTALTGKSGSGAGAAVGAVVGSAIPVIGTFLGSAIGGLLDSVFGSGGYDRWFKIQPGEAEIGRQGFDGANIGNISRSAFGAVTFNTEGKLFEGASQEQAQSVINTLEAFADVEDAIAQQLTEGQLSAVRSSVSRQGILDRTDSTDFSAFYVERFNRVFDSIGGEVDQAFDTLASSLSDQELLQTIDKVAAAAFELAGVSSSINAGIVEQTISALDEHAKIQSDALRTYRDSTVYLDSVIAGYDASADAAGRLSEALAIQQASALDLIATYHNLSGTIDTTFGSAIASITESVMSEEELYNRRRDQITSLVEDLGNTIDPTRIGSISSEIARLASSAFNLLGPDQQANQAGEFGAFLSSAQQTAAAQIQAGLDLVGARDEITEYTLTSTLADLNTSLSALPENIDDAFLDTIEGLSGAIADFQAAVNDFRDARPTLTVAGLNGTNSAGADLGTGGTPPDYELDLDLLTGGVLNLGDFSLGL